MKTTAQTKAIEAVLAAFGGDVDAAVMALRAAAPKKSLPSGAALAAAVRVAAKKCVPAFEPMRDAPSKFWIADILAELGRAGYEADGAALVEAHRAGTIALSRCDLVEAFDAAKVAASETYYRRAEFHFVRI